MSLSNLEKTLLLCIEKTTDDNKLAKLKAQLKEVRDKSLTSNDQDIPTILSVE